MKIPFRSYFAQKRLLRSLRSRVLSPKELKPGMRVCAVQTTVACVLNCSGMPVLVKAVEYPFVVAEVEQAVVDMSSMLSAREPTFIKRSITVDAFNTLWIEVSTEYFEAARMRTESASQPSENSDVVC